MADNVWHMPGVWRAEYTRPKAIHALQTPAAVMSRGRCLEGTTPRLARARTFTERNPRVDTRGKMVCGGRGRATRRKEEGGRWESGRALGGANQIQVHRQGVHGVSGWRPVLLGVCLVNGRDAFGDLWERRMRWESRWRLSFLWALAPASVDDGAENKRSPYPPFVRPRSHIQGARCTEKILP